MQQGPPERSSAPRSAHSRRSKAIWQSRPRGQLPGPKCSTQWQRTALEDQHWRELEAVAALDRAISVVRCKDELRQHLLQHRVCSPPGEDRIDHMCWPCGGHVTGSRRHFKQRTLTCRLWESAKQHMHVNVSVHVALLTSLMRRASATSVPKLHRMRALRQQCRASAHLCSARSPRRNRVT